MLVEKIKPDCKYCKGAIISEHDREAAEDYEYRIKQRRGKIKNALAIY